MRFVHYNTITSMMKMLLEVDAEIARLVFADNDTAGRARVAHLSETSNALRVALAVQLSVSLPAEIVASLQAEQGEIESVSSLRMKKFMESMPKDAEKNQSKETPKAPE